MIKLAVCDDEEFICTQLETILINLLNDMFVEYEIDIFYTGEALCKKLSEEVYDMIFLDIELPLSSGIDIGQYIRETLQNDVIQIAYISAKKQYANDLFDFRPINFLIKPLDESKVKKVLDTYFRITKRNEQLFTYKKERTYYKVPINKIIYFENTKRKVKIVTTDSEDEFYDTIEKLYEQLKHYKFLLVHKSYLINSKYIKTMTYEEVIMTNHIRIPISQSKRKEVRNIYTQIIKENF